MKELRILTVTTPAGKNLKPVARYTEKSAGRYANRMYHKYDDGVKVEESLTIHHLGSISTTYGRSGANTRQMDEQKCLKLSFVAIVSTASWRGWSKTTPFQMV
jgi:hypothetical protein